ncbi:retrovirus-related pol polyprotein from transposon TNT 1-94 [Tanacetum coccineum]|uniref:Retrovirus-related pol polyprotein from transposon TNT 1-94 n=1 Tax=Tanacetum coccineum TaxID=301880 RepID=A0ABQ5IEE0_9ASTR
MLYDSNVITKETNVILIADSEETLMIEEESRSKMLLKQSDPMVLEKKANTKPIDYAELNRLSEDFVVPKLFYLTVNLDSGSPSTRSEIDPNSPISFKVSPKGLGHNLFSVGQFYDSDLKAAFRKHTCFVRNLEGVDLLSESRGTNQYSLSIRDMMASSPIRLLSKDTKTKSWLWHRRLSHLKFAALNHLARNGLVRGLPRLKFKKDHLCFACAMVKSKKQSHKAKSEDTNQETLYLLHTDLCGPMRVASVNGKKFGISHKTSVTRTPQQNSVVEWRNRTLVEAARTMLIYAKAPLYLWAESVATTCYTQNRSIIRHRHRKTPYELLHDGKPDLSYLHIFGALCYPNNDSENLGKLQAKVDIASVASLILVEEAPTLVESTGLPSSTSVDQDAPSPSTSQTTPESQSLLVLKKSHMTLRLHI